MTLAGSTSFLSRVFYAGSEPLPGDWRLLRVLLHGHTSDNANTLSRFGVRLGTEVPTDDDEWVRGERIWRSTSLRDSFEDENVVTYETPVCIEGPWAIKPRGRRLLLRGYFAGSGVSLMAATFVVEAGRW